jgi:hypothetical protein
MMKKNKYFFKIFKSFEKSRRPPLALLKPFVKITMRRFIIRRLPRDFSTNLKNLGEDAARTTSAALV